MSGLGQFPSIARATEQLRTTLGNLRDQVLQAVQRGNGTPAPEEGGEDLAEPSTLEKIKDKYKPTLQGGVSHKDAIKAFYNYVEERAQEVEQAGESWGDRQSFFNDLAKEGTGIDHLTDKQKNYLYVANIMRNPEILSNAAKFFLKVSEQYKGNELLSNVTAEVRHAWPDTSAIEEGELAGEKNSTERGMKAVFQMQARELGEKVAAFFNSGETVSVADGLEATKGAIEELGLADKEEYTLEEASFILRATLQLRDVFYNCKPIKSEATALAENDGRPTRIVGPQGDSRGEAYTHRLLSVYENEGTAAAYRKRGGSVDEHQDNSNPLERMAKNRTHPEDPKNWDYNNGFSATTLGLYNFMALMQKNAAETSGKDMENFQIDNNEIIQVTQALYASWHFIAPDGYAHSQVESINTLLELCADTHLNSSILTPFTERDVPSMLETKHHKEMYAQKIEKDERYLLSKAEIDAKKEKAELNQ